MKNGGNGGKESEREKKRKREREKRKKGIEHNQIKEGKGRQIENQIDGQIEKERQRIRDRKKEIETQLNNGGKKIRWINRQRE